MKHEVGCCACNSKNCKFCEPQFDTKSPTGIKFSSCAEDHYKKRVEDSIAYIRAEMAKGFYSPDKEPLEVIIYAAEEGLKK